MVALFTRFSDIDDDSICHDSISLFARPLLRARICVRIGHIHTGMRRIYLAWCSDLQKFGQSTMYASIIHHNDFPPLVNRFVPTSHALRTKLIINFKEIQGSKDEKSEEIKITHQFPSKVERESEITSIPSFRWNPILPPFSPFIQHQVSARIAPPSNLSQPRGTRFLPIFPHSHPTCAHPSSISPSHLVPREGAVD